MDKIDLKDFLSYRYLSSPVATGKGIVFVGARADEKENRYSRNLLSLENGRLRKLTHDGKMTSPVFFSGSIFFLGDREEKKEEGSSRIYELPLDGGEARLAYEIGYRTTSFRFLSDGRIVLLYTTDARYENLKPEDRAKKEKENADWEEIEEFPFYHNGGTFSANTYTRLAILDPTTKKTRNLTPRNFDVGYLEIDDEGKKAYVLGNRRRPAYELFNDLVEIEIDTGKTKKLLARRKWDISAIFLMNGTIVVAANDGRRTGINQNADFYKVEDGTLVPFASWGEAMYSSVGSDTRLGGGRISEVHDGKIYFVTTLRNRSLIVSLDKDGKFERIRDAEGSVDSFCFSGNDLYSVEMRDMELEEIYVNGVKATDLNSKVLEGKYVARPEKITFVDKDGIDIDGWVLRPKDFENGKKYPAILDIHGGPKTVYGEVFYHEMQVWASMGYFVMFCNPRGSDGRGDSFADIRGKYGTVDYEDIMEFKDRVLERYPEIDRNNVGATGGSYGGFMSNWILGHTDFFKAIATQRSICNWTSMWGTSDIGTYFVDDQNAASLMDGDFDKVLEHSPLPAIMKNAKTPTLIIHSDEDYRCPVEQGYQLLTALVTKGVEARLVLFHKENHELSRSGKPKARVKRLEEITSWFEKHLRARSK